MSAQLPTPCGYFQHRYGSVQQQTHQYEKIT